MSVIKPHTLTIHPCVMTAYRMDYLELLISKYSLRCRTGYFGCLTQASIPKDFDYDDFEFAFPGLLVYQCGNGYFGVSKKHNWEIVMLNLTCGRVM